MFFSGWRNGVGGFAGKVGGKNFGIVRGRNTNAQLVAVVGFVDTTMARGFWDGERKG